MHDSLLLGGVNDGLGEGLSDDGLFKDLVNDFLSVLNVSSLEMSLLDDGNMSFFNESGVLLVNNRLMVLMDVLLINDGLVVLVDNVLVMLMNNIFLVFHKNVLVMLMDNVLMNLLHNRGHGVGLSHGSLISVHNLSSFVERLHDSSFVVLNNDGLFVDLFDVSLSSHHVLVSVHVGKASEALSLNEVGLLEVLRVGDLSE